MNPSSLQAAVGGSWSRLLLYPGGLAACGLALLLAWLWGQRAAAPAIPFYLARQRWGLLPALAAPLLALSALPAPGSSELRVPIDTPALALLLEAPMLLLCLGWLRSGLREQPLRYLAGLLTAAPVLVLALVVLAAQGGSLLPDRLPPLQLESALAMLCWLSALPALLQLGPWHIEFRVPSSEFRVKEAKYGTQNGAPAAAGQSGTQNPARAWLLAARLRQAGHVSLAALPWVWFCQGLLPEALDVPLVREQGLFLLIFLALALLLRLADRLGRRVAMRRWGMGYYLPLALLIGLLLAQGLEAMR